MKIKAGKLEGLFHLQPKLYPDSRGYFFEAFNKKIMRESGLTTEFCQDNQSRSTKGTLRGLHFQRPTAQTKLVRVLEGEIFDVAVDIRLDSPHFGRWEAVILSAENKWQFLIPEGFAHGFQVLSEEAEVLYKCSAPYAPQHDRGILWSDPDLAISWPIEKPLLSDKDQALPRLRDLSQDHLFRGPA